ncbi:MAG: hypothetical protein L0220_05465 [Acidobacteria bacterium]|nr:hypothetical protein [Acidobacteriota bacterium]
MLRGSVTSLATSLCLIAIFQGTFAVEVYGQRQYSVDKPRERIGEPTVAKQAAQPTKGVLAVVLDPIINAKVVVKDRDRLLQEQEAGEFGQAEFELERGKKYEVEVSAPNYAIVRKLSEELKGTQLIVRVRMVPQFARIIFPPLPADSQILIDDKLRATAGEGGAISIDDLSPGNHTLLILHPEYNDYSYKLENLEAGVTYTFPRIPLTRVAKLTILGFAGAIVMINGAFQARIGPSGEVKFDYPLEKDAEHLIRVELPGYQPWLSTEMLTPGTHTISAALLPVLTSTGISDFFDNLSLWNAPSTWKVVSDDRNSKLEVSGDNLGTLRDKTYGDFVANFTIWLENGQGATWAVRVDQQGRNYYLFHLAGPKSTTHHANRFYTYLVKDGGEPVEVSTPIPVLVDLAQPGSFTITITVRGNNVRHNIVGNHKVEESDLASWTDTTRTKDQFLYGSFGFRCLSSEIFRVDDLYFEPAK